MKRILSLSLALLMLFALVACTENPAETERSSDSDSAVSDVTDSAFSSTSEETEPSLERPYNPIKEFYILQHQVPESPFKYEKGSLWAEKVADRIDRLEVEHDFTVYFIQVPYVSAVPELQQMNLTGAKGDLFFADNNSKLRICLGTGGEAWLFSDLLELDHILDFWDMEKWGDITSRESMMAGGRYYGVSPALWMDHSPIPFYVMIYNRDLLKARNVSDPQEVWEKEAWDRDAMLNAITSVYHEADNGAVYGFEGVLSQMVRATILTTGCKLAEIDKINSDGTVEWHNGWDSPDVIEALHWLKTSLSKNAKHFNGGKESSNLGWNSFQAVLKGSAAFALTRPVSLFGEVQDQAACDVGLISWAGSDVNVLSGYNESCSSVAIPVFNRYGTEDVAFVMRDLFEGLDGVETREELLECYRETYDLTDADLVQLFREGGLNSYSYWPNGIDVVVNALSINLMSADPVMQMVSKYAHGSDDLIEQHIVPNAVALIQHRQQGYFD